MGDRTLLCGECGREFVFTLAEQEFFRERGFEHDPKRCVACRRQRRRKIEPRGARGRASREPDSTPRTEDASSPPEGRPPRERQRPPRDPATLHDTVCSACGAPTQVPFAPDGVRPVFCMPCLKQQTR